MRKEVFFKLGYRDAGVDNEINIKVDFISNRVTKEYSVIMGLATQAEQANNRISDLYSLITAAEINKEKRWENQIEDYKVELQECTDIILSFNDNNYFQKRHEVLQRILIDNKYGDNDMLMSKEFWDEQVDPSTLIKFMSTVIFKDFDTKKKQRQ